MIRIAILGAAGRMGQTLLRCAPRFSDLQVSAAIDRPETSLPPGLSPVPLVNDPQDAAAADVVIDFTLHAAVPDNVRCAAHAYVVGTTGLTPAEQDAVRKAAQRIPVVVAPNMSLGVNLLLDLVRRAAAGLDEGYDIEIVEMHHRHKLDAPSGTALALAEAAASGRNRADERHDLVQHGRQGMVGERPPGTIGMHALRGGDVVGEHTVVFAGDGERIELTHKASSRDAFAMGALNAARWVHGKPPGWYTMRDVLALES